MCVDLRRGCDPSVISGTLLVFYLSFYGQPESSFAFRFHAVVLIGYLRCVLSLIYACINREYNEVEVPVRSLCVLLSSQRGSQIGRNGAFNWCHSGGGIGSRNTSKSDPEQLDTFFLIHRDRRRWGASSLYGYSNILSARKTGL